MKKLPSIEKLQRQAEKHFLMKSLGDKPRLGKIIICLSCEKEFYVKQSAVKRRKCCSKTCFNKLQKTNNPSYCVICRKEFYVAISTMRDRPKRTCSKACMLIRLSKVKKGNKSEFWRGGRSSKRRKIRASFKNRIWRNKVFERDNYTCQICNIHGTYLQAHHIKSFHQYPQSRFVIKNGLTLCRICHKNIHKKENHAKE